MKDLIRLSYLGPKPAIYIEVLKSINCSHNQIKNSELKNKELQRSLKAQTEIEVPVDLINHLMIGPEYLGPEISILFEDEDFLVLSKPPGVHGFPHSYTENDTCLNWLRSCGHGELLKVNSKGWERGFLNRLDQVTSGVLIYLKKEKVFEMLRHSFDQYIVGKTYLALVHGNVSSDIQNLEDQLSPFGPKGAEMKVVSSGGQTARLSMQGLQFLEDKNMSLVKVSLHTGLRHQIRCQLGHKGHPIVGDVLYKGEKANRVFLHAYEYKIKYQNEERIFTDSHLFSFDDFLDLNSCLKMLGD